MTRRLCCSAVALVLVALSAAVIVPARLTAQAATCDRQCLADMMTRYLNALVARDPAMLPLAPGARFTEDGVELTLGDGLWKSTIALRPYRFDFVDPRQGVIATHAVLQEGSSPVLFAARLKVVDRRISEIETLVAHNADESALFAPNNLTAPTRTMAYVPRAAERMARDQMVSMAARYPAGLRAGSFVTADVPFAPDAYRLENGVKMAGPGCTFQPPSCENMRTQRIPTLAGVTERLLAVDEEMGTVLFLLDFGRGSLPGPKYDGTSLVTFEAFKVYGGQVHAAEAVFKALPLNAARGWNATGTADAAAREALQRATAEDHQDMLRRLGIRALRPGPSGNESAPNHANYDEAVANPLPNLPDVLTLSNGRKVTTPDVWWKQRRPEIVELFDRDVFGRVPKNTPAIRWSVAATDRSTVGGHPVVSRSLVGHADNSAYPAIAVDMQMTLVTPADAAGPVPVMIMFTGRALPTAAEQLIADGWGYAALNPTTVQADNGAGLTKGIIGLVNKGERRKPDDWGALRAWAWGASRALDYLETQPQIDARRVGIDGVSRYGKAALVAMAYDRRFAVVLVGSSGEGGAKLHRRNWGEAVENLTAAGEYHWMAGNFLKYGAADATFGSKNAGDLPVDAHELIALCAPRPVFISYGVPEKGDAKWLDHQGSFMAAIAAQPVFTLLGAKGLGRSNDYRTEKMPAVNVALLDGQLAWRQHDGGHTDGPNWQYFIPWADRMLGRARSSTVMVMPGTHAHIAAASGIPQGIPRFCDDASIVTSTSGRWSDPRTWSTGRIPGAGDRVLIDAAHTITYDVVSDASLSCVDVAGSLSFRTDDATRLQVGTLTVLEGGTLEIGTASHPVAPGVSAEVVIADRPIDTTVDPGQFGTGIIGLGTVRIAGAAKSPTFVRLAAEALAGQTTLTTELTVNGWRAGDTLVIPDTRQLRQRERGDRYEPQWEEATISSVAGTTITVSAPLRFDHKGARTPDGTLEFLPHVGNITRNVVVRSEHVQGTRGHVMFVEHPDVDIRYAQFRNLGRTRMGVLDNTEWNDAGGVRHVGTNQIGRYAIHFHHAFGPRTTPASGDQFTLLGNAVDAPSKWGITVHNSHFGLIQDNIVYDAHGAAFVAEDGTESDNTFVHNFAIRVDGSGEFAPRSGYSGAAPDPGGEGAGFWLRGPNNVLRDNVAADAEAFGYGIAAGGLGTVRIPRFKGADPSEPDAFDTLDTTAAPLRGFVGNEAYGAMQTGVAVGWNGSLEHLRVWHTSRQGIAASPTDRLVVDDVIVRGDPAVLGDAREAPVGIWFNNYAAKSVTVRRANVQGLRVGVASPFLIHVDVEEGRGDGTATIEDSYFRDYVGVAVATAYTTSGSVPAKRAVVRSSTFAPLATAKPGLYPAAAISMNYGMESGDSGPRTPVVVYDFNQKAGDTFRVFYSRGLPVSANPCGAGRTEVDGFVCTGDR